MDCNILAIDTSTKLASLWKQVIDDNFTLLEAVGGFEAVKLIKENDISVIIVNISSIHVNGVESIKKIRENYPKIPIIVIFNSKDKLLLKQASEYGIQHAVLLPVNIDTLLSFVMKYVPSEKLKTHPDPPDCHGTKQKKQKDIMDVESVYYSGLSAIASGEYKKAIEIFSQLFSITRIKKEGLLKYIEDALFQTAQCYCNLKDYEKSNKYYIDFINKAPHSPSYKTALLSIGENYEAVKNYSIAVKYYKKVLTLPEIDSYRTKAKKALKRLALKSG